MSKEIAESHFEACKRLSTQIKDMANKFEIAISENHPVASILSKIEEMKRNLSIIQSRYNKHKLGLKPISKQERRYNLAKRFKGPMRLINTGVDNENKSS